MSTRPSSPRPPERPPAAAPEVVRWVLAAAGVAAAGYLLARYVRLGTPQGPWAYWPLNGLLCGLLYRRPWREWPGMGLGAAAGHTLTVYLVRGDIAGGVTVTGALIAAAQAALGAGLLRRVHGRGSPLGSARELALFVAGSVCTVPLLASPLAALAYARAFELPYFAAWWPLFVGNSLSILLFAPLTLHPWRDGPDEASRWPAGRPERALCLGSVLALAALIFTGIPLWLQYLMLPYLLLAPLAWAALRCGPYSTALAVFLVATVSAWCTSRGLGPFATPGVALDVSMVMMETYLAFVGLTALMLSAMTEHHRSAYADLALQSAIQRAFLESSNTPLVLQDLEGHYLMLNRAAEQVMGRPREQLIGRTARDLVPPEQAERVALHDRRALERAEPYVVEDTLDTPQGRRTLVITRFPVRDASGAVRYLGVSGRDETVERALDTRLARAQRVELLGQLAAGLAHDLNNLLTVVTTNTRMLRSRASWPADEVAEMLDDAADASERAQRLVSRLMSAGRPAAHDESTPVVADEVLSALTPLLRALTRGRGEVLTQLDAPGLMVRAEASELEQVVLNLVANARDAITPEGRITLRTELALQPTDGPAGAGLRRSWRLAVSDTGSGMDEATLAQLFQPFFTTKDASRGTGLGLYTTSLLVRRLGGEVRVSSRPGAGTTFTVDLPAAAPEVD